MGDLLSQAGWEWKGAWPSRAAIPPVTEENVRPAANFARSQTSLQQFPNRNQEVTSSLVFHQDKDESAPQSLFRKNPRSWSLIILCSFLYPDELGKVWLNQREAEGRISLILTLFVTWLPGHIFTPVDSHVANNQILGGFTLQCLELYLSWPAWVQILPLRLLLSYVMRLKQT